MGSSVLVQANALCPPGCYPRCPKNRPIFDEDRKKCVPADKCGCYLEDIHYPPGASVPPEHDCQAWYLSSRGRAWGLSAHAHGLACAWDPGPGEGRALVPAPAPSPPCSAHAGDPGGGPGEAFGAVAGAWAGRAESGQERPAALLLLSSLCTASSQVVCWPEEGKLPSAPRQQAAGCSPRRCLRFAAAPGSPGTFVCLLTAPVLLGDAWGPSGFWWETGEPVLPLLGQAEGVS